MEQQKSILKEQQKEQKGKNTIEESNSKQNYGFFTATTMIIGTVIGSGIFFKSDNILNNTGGNVWLGVLVFCIAAFGIVFGSLTIIELANKTDKNGGVVGYFEEFISKKIACGFGWFQTFVYYPTLIVVISWVAGIYTCSFFGISNTLEMQCVLAIVYMIFFYGMNFLSAKAGGYFQNISTFIKLIPLLLIALVGFFWSAPHPVVETGIEVVGVRNVGIAWLAALAPTAFSFDGWVVATSITNEVKNSKKNMTLALIVGPIIILAVYLAFFLGLTNMLGVEYILSTGDSAINKVGELLLGQYGTKILIFIVIIAVLGVVNGLILGGIRLPHALASKKMIPGSNEEEMEKAVTGRQFSVKSWIISLVSCLLWLVVHYFTQRTQILQGGDISEIAIVFSYVCYIVLYMKVIKMKKDGTVTSIFRGTICPILATIGAGIIFIGGLYANFFYSSIFVVFCFIIFASGVLFYTKRGNLRIK